MKGLSSKMERLASITQRVKDKQVKLFGHLIRANTESDHTKKVRAHQERTGRPRLKWYDMAKQAVIENLTNRTSCLEAGNTT